MNPSDESSVPLPEPEEMLDRPDLPYEVRLRSLRDLARVNRLLLGYGPVLRTIVPRLRRAGRPQSLLDLGAGSGDVTASLARAVARRALELRVVRVDTQLAHLVIGRSLSSGVRAVPWAIVADARALPFRDAAVDWAFSNQLLHHFDDADARRMLGEMRRCCRTAAVVVDLRAGWLTRLGGALLLPLIGVDAVNRHDGRVSARRAYGLGRLRELLAGVPVLELRHRFPRRLSLVLPPLASGAADHGQSPK